MTSARAADNPEQGVEIRFVPAAAGGTVSLGIYDDGGTLVRVLCDEWPFGKFHIGLNGLSTVWDGLDSAGQPVAEGSYTARGFVVGNVEVAGEAFHFNDWIEDADSPRIVGVAAQQMLPGGDILLMARLAGQQGALVRYSPESEARWHKVVSEPRPEPAREAQLAVSDSLAFALLDGKLRAASLQEGAEIPIPVSAQGVKAVAARGNRLALLDTNGVRFYALPQFAPQGEAKDLPSAFVSIALLDQGAVAADADGAVWRWQAGWSKLEIPQEIKVLSVSSGREDTFWAMEKRADGFAFVAHYSPERGRLADWSAPGDGEQLASLAGDPATDYFVATLVSPHGERTVAIRRRDGGEGWEYVFDKKITRCADFGWNGTALVPSGGSRPQEITVRLAENPLDPGAARGLVLRAAMQSGVPTLATSDGLPLLRLSAAAGYGGAMMLPGDKENSARFFQGDEACVEEYSLSNLGDITSFDAGTLKMKGGQESAPPPAEEPQSAAP